eukprot:TRINITY_DN474_c0_g1_i2.p1 TRINITY_DN474_c0_g1~~TRINITY_DN474_c0_g1_i2.p1  ORF type:complete len:443 (+),score=175.08 TRINITY_DN474_c0_g1_i2:173-1501(+)
MPGGIDPHTHMEMPFMGTHSIDDFESGTRSAICGGTTSIIDFIIPAPKQSLIEAYNTWRKKMEKATCSVGLHMAVTWESEQVLKEMGELANEHGVNSFKFFLAYKNALMLQDESLIKCFARARELGCLSQVHAENGEMVAAGQKKIFDMGITGPEGHGMSRPVEVEIEATNRAIGIAKFTNAPLYVVHVSSADAADSIARARAAGQRVFGEALAIHLTKDDSEYLNEDWARAAAHVLSPPLRPKGNQERLWLHLKNRSLQTTATDNCTFKTEQKMKGADDFRKIPNGAGSTEERMTVVYKGVNDGTLSLCDFVRATSTASAKIFNMYPKKGIIMEGADADVVVWNPKATRTISAKTHHQKVDTNVWEGETMTGCNTHTIAMGRLAWECIPDADGKLDWTKGKVDAPAGSGHYEHRKPFCPIVYDGLDKAVKELKGVKRQRKE